MGNFNTLINTVTIGASFMIGLLFLSAHFKNKKGNLFLGLFLWSLSYIQLSEIEGDNFLSKLETTFEIGLFILVFLFFYLIRTINKPFKKWYWLLFIPGILMNIVLFLNDNLSRDNDEMNIFKIFYLFDLVLVIYVFKILGNHKKKVNNYYSNIEQKTLTWLKSLIYFIILLHASFILENILPIENSNIILLFNSFPSLIIFTMVYWIGYNGFSQPEIFNDVVDITKDKIKEIKQEDTLAKSQKEYDYLKETIQEKRLYAKQNITLRDLALSLEMKENRISALIKLHSKTTFYHFINRFRVEEFKKSMKSTKSKQLSVFGLAQEVGFSSKSTFYSAFKAVEGMTPKQYEQTLKEFD
ncbi:MULTISPECIES: helix-turn-helix domain-containing protein [unclassified Tenacibaculum]|uniref:helix-turn-helix domain-containing protein n=1 Tax=unclassified Tenacibaculum TaxID=2635139 RepID=UPI001F2B6441|nr:MULTISPECIES: helix-turn-helix domain-containing protein [unclassified Tenacibaculum]MCF2875201.1 AraC family transcriptional regulator [Tenacibaculum sp. Cn5-1]MCF2935277.1 AraC family transcriptional regulator [Tenacibaculum sp. Cn5-34]MCG7511281.1 AraC family transcriptional regulator [Tenacibaculum sp. Cn5-46]